MRKIELARRIAEDTGLTNGKAEEAVDAILDAIKTRLSAGESVILRRFGTFDVRAKGARVGRNPKTGEAATVSARRVVRFKSGKRLKASVHDPVEVGEGHSPTTRIGCHAWVESGPDMPNRHPLGHPLVIFKPSRIHGIGGFAWVDLRKGQRIIEYIGPKISKAKGLDELEKGNAYLFFLDEAYDIDGSVAWNPARFLNHSCVPNCEAVIVRERIWLYALRRIQAGEELTYNYGLGLGGFEERPCHCGASACVGFMVDEQYFATVRHRRGQA